MLARRILAPRNLAAPQVRPARPESLRSKEPDCPLLFVEGAENGSWIGEDYYFSRLAETSGEPLRLLLDAPCEHAGRALKLSAAGDVCLRDAALAKELTKAAESRALTWDF